MIKTYDSSLPGWIARQASLGPNVDIDGIVTEDNAFWSLLTICCPLIFESYAIILHPFGINWKTKELVESDLYEAGLEVRRDYTGKVRMSWKEFLSHYGYKFNLETAYSTQVELTRQISGLGWPVYLWAPGEGSCKTEDLQLIIDQIKNIYGDQTVNYFYIFMQSKKWDTGDYFYIGRLSEFNQLKNDTDNIEGINPSAIYPDTKEWCVVSDFDLPFTYIGGSKELINKITKIEGIEIFELSPIFKEKIN